jgi:hypothetical protein
VSRRKTRRKQEELEKSWKQRETALREKEEEGPASARSRRIPARLKMEVDATVSNAVKSAEQRFEQEKNSAEKGERIEAARRLQIQALQDQLARQSAEIEKQRAQVEDAKRQVQDIAIKAIEGASGAQALSHIDKIAMEQAKTRAPQS